MAKTNKGGRPPLPAGAAQTEAVLIRMRRADRKLIDAAAKAADTTIGVYMREVSLRAAARANAK